MAQKGLAQKTGNSDALLKVPKKAGFLGQLEMELVQAGYENVGHVLGGSLNISKGPFKAGLGIGGEKLEYLEDSQFYLAPKLEIRGILGDFELYTVGNAALTSAGKETKARLNVYGTIGTVWEAVPKSGGNGFSLRIGSEFEMSGEWVKLKKFKISNNQKIARLGAAVGYSALTAYVIEDVIYLPKKVYGSWRIDYMDAHHHKLRAGIVVNKSGISVGGEFFQTAFGKGGELSFESRNIAPKLSAWYSQEADVWGGERKLGLLLTMPLGLEGERYKGRHPVWRTGNPIVENTKKEHVGIGSGDERGEFFREAVIASENIAELGHKYRGKGSAEILFAAAMLGGYGIKNYRNIGAKSIKELGVEGSYSITREAISRGVNRLGPNVGSAGICRNINPVGAAFLWEAGWDAFSIDLFDGKVPHNITLGKNPETGKAVLLNYGNIIKSQSGQVWPLLRQYAKKNGFVISGVRVYGANNELIGYYELEEGKLNRAKAGDGDTLKDTLLRSRPRQK